MHALPGSMAMKRKYVKETWKKFKTAILEHIQMFGSTNIQCDIPFICPERQVNIFYKNWNCV